MTEKKPTLAPVKLLRDYWPEEDQRQAAGATIELPSADAKRLISEGVAERADPLPGED